MAKLAMLLLKRSRPPDFMDRLQRWKALLRELLDRDRREAFREVLRYIVRVGDKPEEERRLRRLTVSATGPRGEEVFMSVAERWKREAREEGEPIGQALGRREHTLRSLTRLLDRRGVQLDEDARARLEAADLDTLDGWLMDLFEGQLPEPLS